jgi:molybdopterin biosynthesis enzyme
VVAAERLAAQGLLCFQSFARQRVRILVSGAEGRRERLLGAYRDPLLRRLEALGVTDVGVEYVSLGGEPERTLAAALGQHLDVGVELIIMVGETATMDAEDLTPRAIRQAHGTVEVVGAPVFPGNLLLLGYSGRSAILGAPGCVRSRARNVVDLILPRLLLGERLGARHIAELGLGGLLGGSEHGEGGDTAGREHE